MNSEPLSGDVEVDETGVHGKPRGPRMTKKEAAHWRERQSVSGWSSAGQVKAASYSVAQGASERPDPRQRQPIRILLDYSMDGLISRWQGESGAIASSTDRQAEYVDGDIDTNTIQGAFLATSRRDWSGLQEGLL